MLVFLHGFLGDPADWDEVLFYLPKIDVQAIRLPYLADDIPLSVHQQVKEAKMLIGYSAGGRIAIEMKSRFPSCYEKLMIISSHFGLDVEREKRISQDQEWIEMLREHPLDLFLENWYAQPLFQSLKEHPSFPKVLKRRKEQNPKELIAFLEKYSLGKTKKFPLPDDAICVYGKEDLKYAQLYRTIDAVYAIENAGHAVHIEQPQKLAKIIYEHYTRICVPQNK